MGIIEDITQCSAEYIISTGIKPTRVYLGRGEILALGKWAYDNGYQETQGTAACDGLHRPEVVGLKIYEVNDSNEHMRACA